MTRLVRLVPFLLLAAWFAGMSVLLDHAVRLFERRTTPDPANLAAPAPWRDSRLFVDPDSYAWLSYARDLRESPHFRVRFTRMDNAPFGRPVHWAQLPVWSLCAIAAGLEAVGIPAPGSLELAGRILLPLLGFLFFSALWFFLHRRIPPLLAALVVLSLAVALFWDFHPLRPDHHGFHLAAAAAFVLPLLFSSFGLAPPSRRGRLPFILSGFFGGVALWLGATVFYFALAAAALAAVLAIFPKPSSASPVTPRLWRLWGIAGFASSLFFWLLEYAPNHFGMRLEANHPLYALSFLGIGETLCCFACWRHQNRRLSPAFLAHFAFAVAAAASLPALVLFGPADWYIPRSPLMLRLHARDIDEFLSLAAFASVKSRSFAALLLPPLLPAIAAIPLLRRPFSRRALFALPFFFVFLALFLWQNRWERFTAFSAALLFLAAVSAPPPPLRHPLFSRFLPPALLLLQLCWGLWNNMSALPALFRGLATDPAYLRAFQFRALAAQIRPAISSPDVVPTPHASAPVVLAPAEFAPSLWYFARIPSLASLYWENLPGNAAAAAAFADPDPDAPSAAAVVASRRVSHLFMLEGAQDALFFDHLHTGIYSHPHAAHTLAGILAGALPDVPLPPWLAVDPALNNLANPSLYTYVPPRCFFVPVRFPLRIYSLRPPS